MQDEDDEDEIHPDEVLDDLTRTLEWLRTPPARALPWHGPRMLREARQLVAVLEAMVRKAPPS